MHVFVHGCVCLCKCACVCLPASVFVLVPIHYVGVWLFFVCACLKRGLSPWDRHQRPNIVSNCLPSLNELTRSSEKGSSFLTSISNKMNHYARFAIHSIFSFVLSNQGFKFYFQMNNTSVMHTLEGPKPSKNFFFSFWIFHNTGTPWQTLYFRE